MHMKKVMLLLFALVAGNLVCIYATSSSNYKSKFINQNFNAEEISFGTNSGLYATLTLDELRHSILEKHQESTVVRSNRSNLIDLLMSAGFLFDTAEYRTLYGSKKQIINH